MGTVLASELAGNAAGRLNTEIGLSSALVASKLVPPSIRAGTVERANLLKRLASGATCLSIVAPAGYGKTTLLRQWAGRRSRPTAWLSLDTEDNDPVVLLTYLAAALDRIVRVEDEVFLSLAVEYPSVPAISRQLGRALWESPAPFTLVFDDVHTLTNPSCQDIVALLVKHVPVESQVAFGSRGEPPLPLARLRAEGRILEVGPAELALDEAEATTLLSNVNVTLPEQKVQDLVDLTEGWPAAIYLAARSVSGTGKDINLSHFGQSRQLVAYANAELLSGLPAEMVQFLTRSSVLDRMSGPLCDAVLRTSGSARRLESLVQSNLLVMPLDEHRSWYRYHHLFRDLLRAELEVREPGLAIELCRRAARWCHAHDLLDAAVDYAMAGGDTERAADIVEARTLPLYRAGRVVTLGRWFNWFDRDGHIPDYPRIAVVGAWTAALTGRAAAAERWASAAERATPGARVSLEPFLALLRAVMCRDGVDRALTDARAADRLLPVDSPWQATAQLVLGINHLLAGSSQEAEAAYTRAVQVGNETGALPAVSVALAERALLAAARDDTAAARSFIDDACAVVDSGRLQDQPTNAFVYAVAARLAMRNGDTSRAAAMLGQAQRLRTQLTYAVPHIAVQARLEVIRTLLGMGDPSGARTVLREVDDVLRLRPDLGVLSDEVRDLRAQVSLSPTGAIGSSSLTAAELRLLPLLQTHLSFREIGERLHVSPNTIKTQAISIYRKLGVSSRSDAIRRAAEVGLLPR